INLEITEVTSLPAERDVQVQPEGRAGSRCAVESGQGFGHVLGFPERVGRVVRDEVTAHGGAVRGGRCLRRLEYVESRRSFVFHESQELRACRIRRRSYQKVYNIAA